MADERWYTRSAKALACGLLIGAVGLALLHGVADLAASNGRVLLSQLSIQARQLRPTQWQDAVDGLRLARHLVPWNAEYHADLGRLYEWQSWQQIHREEAAVAYRNAALISYREALARRPGWGYVWAQLAHVSLAARGFNEEVEHALSRVALLAPWELEAQRTVIWLGLSRWSALSEQARDRVRDTVRRAWTLGDHRGLILAMAAQFGWGAELQTIRVDVARAEASR